MSQAIVAAEDNEYDEEDEDYEYYYDEEQPDNDHILETEEPLNALPTSVAQETNEEYIETANTSEKALPAPNTTSYTGESMQNNGDFTHILHEKDESTKNLIQVNVLSCCALLLAILSLIILLIGIIMGSQNNAFNSGINSADAMGVNQNKIIIHHRITNHRITNNISIKPSYNFSFEPADIGPYEGYNHTNPQIFYPGGKWWGWQFWTSKTVQDSVRDGVYAGGADVNVPKTGLADIHVKYGDKLIFRMFDAKNDDLLLVTKEIFDECNFSSIADGNDVTNVSAGALLLSDKYGLRNDRANRYNISDLGGYMINITDRSNVPINSVKEELLAADILYFTSSYRWYRDDSHSQSLDRACKMGWKQRVIIEGYRNKTMDVMESNMNAIIDAAEIQDLTAGIGHLSRMLILQQFSFENRIRSEGDSGITNVRGSKDGHSAYDDGTYSNGNVLSIHNHANNEKVVGIGELAAVLNGVEFQTRHNDYNLNMPHRESGEYHATERIPYPSVPPQVLGQQSIAEQVSEMQEWFRAFKEQNRTHRNYTLYFRPVLCYLEGTWITDSDSLKEPFASDRHYIDAKTWKELHDKVRWMANSGRKNSLENYATLPSSIRNLVNDTFPIVSNWEYRILCAPLSNDIEIERFRVTDDLSVQLMGSPETRKELKYSRKARFELNKNLDCFDCWDKGQMRWNYLDYLMEQIPGKDNYGANLTDRLPDGSSETLHINDNSRVLNSGYYSRFYSLSDADAMGASRHRRGYSDRYLFAAKTTQQKVSPVQFEFESENGTVTETISRWSYAIPIEVIYMTPLSAWNPYNIAYVSDSNLFDATKSGKCGQNPSQAWTNLKNSIYYMTPSEFFEGNHNEDSADTAVKGACAVGSDGSEHNVEASGHWIVFPSIGNGVGYVRQRYPIFPIHHGGSAAYKETKALQDTVLPPNYDDVNEGIDFWTDSRDLEYGFNLYLEGGGHDHMIFVKGKDVKKYWFNATDSTYNNGTQFVIGDKSSDVANGHTHTVDMYRWRDTEDKPWVYEIIRCRYGLKGDDIDVWQNQTCFDFHDTLRRDTGEESNVKGLNA